MMKNFKFYFKMNIFRNRIFSLFLCCSQFFFVAFFDNTDSHGLFHISDGKSSKWGVFTEDFTAHCFTWNHIAKTSISSLNKFGEFFKCLTSSSINLASNFSKFNSNMCSMAIQDWGVTVLDLTWMVKNNNLG